MTDPFAAPSGDQPAQPTQSFPPQTPVYGAPQAPPPYGAPPVYGAPPPYGAPVPGQSKNGLGTAALVLGILSIVFCWTVVGGLVLGVLGIVFGAITRGRVKRQEASNPGIALAGIITGAVGVVFAIGFIALFVVLANSDSVKNLRDCLDNASTQSDRDQCSVQFSNDFNR